MVLPHDRFLWMVLYGRNKGGNKNQKTRNVSFIHFFLPMSINYKIIQKGHLEFLDSQLTSLTREPVPGRRFVIGPVLHARGVLPKFKHLI